MTRAVYPWMFGGVDLGLAVDKFQDFKKTKSPPTNNYAEATDNVVGLNHASSAS